MGKFRELMLSADDGNKDYWGNTDEGVNLRFRPSLLELIGKQDIVMCEIGVFNGNNAKLILDNLNIKKIYLIDIKITKAAKDLLMNHKDKIVYINSSSSHAVNKIKDKLDFVYIDGSHVKADVTEDIIKYIKLLKPNSVIAGHDFKLNIGKILKSYGSFTKEHIQQIDLHGVSMAVLDHFGIDYEEVLNWFEPTELGKQFIIPQHHKIDRLNIENYDWWAIV